MDKGGKTRRGKNTQQQSW